MVLDYEYPNGVLINKLGITTAEDLQHAESNLSNIRTASLDQAIQDLSYTQARLKAIHHHLFQDVYTWAGQYRTVNISKAAFEGEEAKAFVHHKEIEPKLELLFKGLKRDKNFTGYKQDRFIRASADLLGNLNNIHPFREGNGRTQRRFVAQLAYQAGYHLGFPVITKERNIRASIAFSEGDKTLMRELITDAVDEDKRRALAHAISFLEQNGVNWNDLMIATTQAGKRYQAKVIGVSGEDFMMQAADHSIFIGKVADLGTTPSSRDEVDFRVIARKEPEAER